MTDDPGMTRGEARADAAAAKAREKAMRPWYRKKRFWLLGAVVLLVVIVAASSGGSDDEEPVATDRTEDTEASDDGSDTTQAEADETADTYAIGDTARTSDFEVTLHAVENPFDPDDDFSEPEPGHHYVGVELEVKNLDNEQQTFSTLAYTEILDSQNRAWDVEYTGTNRPAVEGDMPAGASRRGWVVFEVGDDAQELRLRVKGSFTASGAIFVL